MKSMMFWYKWYGVMKFFRKSASCTEGLSVCSMQPQKYHLQDNAYVNMKVEKNMRLF